MVGRCAAIARVVVGGAFALSLFAASQAPALAYSPDQVSAAVHRPITSPGHVAIPARTSVSAAPGSGPAPAPRSGPTLARLTEITTPPIAPAITSSAASTAATSAPGPRSSVAPAGSVPVVAISPTLPTMTGASAILSPVVIASPETTAAIVSAPGISQFDGSIWAASDCGPTSLAMALGALGIQANPLDLRQLANAQMGMSDPNVGTSWNSLAAAARHFGLQTSAINQNGNVRTWTVDEVKQELAQGHPVLLLTHYRDLPNHPTSTYTGDHYIVALGVDTQGNLVYNDPASAPNDSFTHTMSPAQLERAWTHTNFGMFRTAMAIYK